MRLAAPAVRLALLALLALPAAAQEVSLELRQASLQEITGQLARQTGYDFRVAVGKEISEARLDVRWKQRSLAAALAELGAAFKCDFFSVDPSGFFVTAAEDPPEKELPIGPYRLRVSGPTAGVDAGALQLVLVFVAPDDHRMEAVAGLGPDLRVLDNFGRALVAAPTGHPDAAVRRTGAARVRLTEYWHRLTLTPRDSYATRVRSLRGSLVVYRQVTPLRLVLPLGSGAAEARERDVTARLVARTSAERGVRVTTHLEWSEAGDASVVGRGISRTPAPYLLDDRGRVYRDWTPRTSRRRSAGGRVALDQQLEFAGVGGTPARLVYDLFLREEPDIRLPFRLADLPFPGRESAAAPRDGGPFFQAGGGILSLQVLGRDGRPVEGEVALGLERREGAGWSGRRWVELATDREGRVRLDGLLPGTYRVTAVFRLDPLAPPVPSAAPTHAPGAAQRAPGAAPGHPEASVTAGRETVLSPLRLPLQAEREE